MLIRGKKPMMQTSSNKIYQVATFLACFAYAGLVYADIPTLDQVLETFSGNIPNLMAMVTSFGYVFGIYLVVKGVFALKKQAEQRTMMSTEHSLKGPIIFITVGALLIWLPTSIDTAMNTLWLQPSPFAYQVDEGNPWSSLIKASFLVLQLIGVIAFIRGLIIMTHLAGQGGQPGTFAKGITHIIGGILCINMYDTVRTILISFGLDNIFS